MSSSSSCPSRIPPSELDRFAAIAGIELRNLLSESTGLELPSTLLYDNPSISLISGYVDEEIMVHFGAADSEEVEADDAPRLTGDAAASESADRKPSADSPPAWGEGAPAGHTTLRALIEPSPTPIFFIAPLAVGGQRAYYNFARQFLSWTKPNPLYSLDHDTLGKSPERLASLRKLSLSRPAC